MLLTDLRAAELKATAAGGVDQAPGLVAGRVLEGRAAGLGASGCDSSRAAAMRSISAPIALGSPGVPRSGRRRRSRLQAAPSGGMNSELARGQAGPAAPSGTRRRNRRGCRAPRAHRRRRSSARTADGARNAAQEFEPAIPASRAVEETRMPLAPPPQRIVVAAAPRLRKRLAEPHDHARHPAVADDQVRAEPERHHRRAPHIWH